MRCDGICIHAVSADAGHALTPATSKKHPADLKVSSLYAWLPGATHGGACVGRPGCSWCPALLRSPRQRAVQLV